MQDKLWVNGSIRRWVVNKYVTPKNPDGTQALDDNTLKNYSGKAVYSASQNQKFTFSYNWNNKIRGHRRDTPPNNVPDIAALVQTNPASATQAKYTGIHKQPGVRVVVQHHEGRNRLRVSARDAGDGACAWSDSTLDSANFAAQRQEAQPNSRTQFDNIVSYSKSGWGGDHLFKGGIQFSRLYFQDQYDVLNDMYLNYNNGKPMSVSEYNTPTTSHQHRAHARRFLPGLVDGREPADAEPRRALRPQRRDPPGAVDDGRPVRRRAELARSRRPISQNLFVWRTGAVYDPIGRRASRPSRRATAATACRSASIASRTSTRCSPRQPHVPLDRSERRRHRAARAKFDEPSARRSRP